MVGLILGHLGRMCPYGLKKRAYDQAYNNYFPKVIINKKRDSHLWNMALKEKILMGIANRDPQVLTDLVDAEPQQIRNSIFKTSGPDLYYGLLFTDLAQFGNFAKGALEEVFEYDQERANDRFPGTSRKFHDAILRILAQNFFLNLKDRYPLLGLSRTGSALSDFFKNQKLQEAAYLAEGAKRIKWIPTLWINVLLHKNESFQALVKLTKIFLPLAILAYGIWLVKSHKKIARYILKSSYHN
jgi:hypothetical protein